MIISNEETIINVLNDEKYLHELEIDIKDVEKAIKMALDELRELEDIISLSNKSNEKFKDLCDRLQGHNLYINNKDDFHNYFDLNYKSLCLTIVENKNYGKDKERLEVLKNDVYVYPNNITKVSTDEMFIIDFNKNIDFKEIYNAISKESEEEIL